MRIKMKQRSKVFFAILAAVGVLMVFQNCADPLEFAGQDAASVENNLPFAFETKMDTISYMSCSNIDVSTFQPRAIYTFRMGAYTSGHGIRLSEEFMGLTKGYADSERANSLFASPLNRSASLQIALRKAKSYQEVLINSDGIVREGFDFSNFLAPLDTSGIATRLAVTPEGDYVSYFAGTAGLGTRFVEQSIRFIESESKADQMRNHLMGIGVDRPSHLSLTYSAGLDQPYFARAPIQGAGDYVFGVGYEVGFRTAHGYNGAPRRGLSTIEEYTLTDGRKNPNAVWNCGQDNYSFMVVRPQDAPAQGCATAADPSPTSLNAVQKKRLELIRRVLRPEDWFVDVTRAAGPCVVRKNNNARCYGDIDGEPTVSYAKACVESGTTVCPHFVSVCERTN